MKFKKLILHEQIQLNEWLIVKLNERENIPRQVSIDSFGLLTL